MFVFKSTELQLTLTEAQIQILFSSRQPGSKTKAIFVARREVPKFYRGTGTFIHRKKQTFLNFIMVDQFLLESNDLQMYKIWCGYRKNSTQYFVLRVIKLSV